MKYCNQKRKYIRSAHKCQQSPAVCRRTEAPKDIKQIHLHPKTEYNSNIIIHAKDYNPLTHTPTSWQPLTHMINVLLITDITHKANLLKSKSISASFCPFQEIMAKLQITLKPSWISEGQKINSLKQLYQFFIISCWPNIMPLIHMSKYNSSKKVSGLEN